jgi:hypothetical protein
MQTARAASIKHREIGFRGPHPDPRQAHSAAEALGAVAGVVSVSVPNPTRNSLHISYDLTQIGLLAVESLLTELGFHLDDSLLFKLKRALYYFTEQNELDSRGITHDQDHNTREVFMRCYRCKSHGCRDERPEYWRKYL